MNAGMRADSQSITGTGPAARYREGALQKIRDSEAAKPAFGSHYPLAAKRRLRLHDNALPQKTNSLGF